MGIIANRAKRPRYERGQRLSIVAPDIPSLNGWQGVVRAIHALQRADGYVLAYFYRLEMDNLAAVELSEDYLAPVEKWAKQL